MRLLLLTSLLLTMNHSIVLSDYLIEVKELRHTGSNIEQGRYLVKSRETKRLLTISLSLLTLC